jgi:hypothetical protein
MPTQRPSRTLATTGKLIAVVDQAVEAPDVIAALGKAGINTSDVSLLRGTEGASRIDATGADSGLWARLRKVTSFTLVDQMPDFAVYQAALLGGRAVLAIPIPSDEMKDAAVQVLRRHGAHFINVYGRFATEEIEAWRGPELEIPDLLRR